jgi:hypothetical protein
MRTCASVWQAYFRQKAAPPRGDKASVWAILLDTIGSRTNDGSVRMIARLLLGLGVSIALVSSAIAELAMTGAPVTMRVGPTGNAGIVQRIPQRAEISLEKCLRDWCRASWRGRFGYIPEEAVVLRPPPATLPGDEMPPPVVCASPTYATPPAWRWTGPYVGINGGFGSGSW